MAILSKGCKSENFELHNPKSLNPSFLESKSCDILALCETNLDESTDSGNFSFCQRLSSFHPKGFYNSYASPCSLCEGRTVLHSHRTYLQKTLWILILFLTGVTSLYVLLLSPLSLTLFAVTHVFFYSISSNIDEVLSMSQPGNNVFVFGDSSIHHKNGIGYI